jgi:hypothetical protein
MVYRLVGLFNSYDTSDSATILAEVQPGVFRITYNIPITGSYKIMLNSDWSFAYGLTEAGSAIMNVDGLTGANGVDAINEGYDIPVVTAGTYTITYNTNTQKIIVVAGSAPAPGPAPGPAPSGTHTPVVVNFNTVIDASGNIDVFGEPAMTVENVIVADYHLPVECLYTSANGVDVSGLIEFWEPSNAMGTLNCKLAENLQGVSGDYYGATARLFATEMQKLFCSSFDCSAATPFSSYASQSEEYWHPRDFGRLALSAHAYDLFGHVAATAAITNDQSFMENMLSTDNGCAATGVSGERIAAWRKAAAVAAGPLDAAWEQASRLDANLALRMVKAIVNKGLDANGAVEVETDVYGASKTASDLLSAIVKQVIGQDASRAMDVDNNELAPELHQMLRFYAGDVIYVNVNLEAPNVTYASGQRTDAASLFQTGDGARNYTIKITLA